MPPPMRHIAQWVLRPLPAPLDRTALIANDSVRNELLSSLQLYSEIRDLGQQLLKQNGHANSASSFIRFQAYVRQSISFFKGVEQLEYRSSPLLFYYSFMNLAKAAIFVRDPNFPFGHIHHGLVPSSTNGGLSTQFTTVVTTGVFGRLYALVIGNSIPNRAKLTIKSLMGYLSDLTFEYQYLKFRHPRYAGCKYAIGRNTQEANFRSILAINCNGKLSDRFIQILRKEFSEITLDQSFILNQFELTAIEAQYHKFWESKKAYGPNADGRPPGDDIVADSMTWLSDYIYWIPVDNWPFLFSLNSKIRSPEMISMNEFLATYIIMFFL